jgi:hypothetical protein
MYSHTDDMGLGDTVDASISGKRSAKHPIQVIISSKPDSGIVEHTTEFEKNPSGPL